MASRAVTPDPLSPKPRHTFISSVWKIEPARLEDAVQTISESLQDGARRLGKPLPDRARVEREVRKALKDIDDNAKGPGRGESLRRAKIKVSLGKDGEVGVRKGSR